MPIAVAARLAEGTALYMKRMELAAEIGPEAFKPFSVSHFTDERLWRQRLAEERVLKEHPELAPPVAGA